MKEIHFPCEAEDLKSLAHAMSGLNTPGGSLSYHSSAGVTDSIDAVVSSLKNYLTYSIDAVVSPKHNASVSVDTWLAEDPTIPPHVYVLVEEIASIKDELQIALQKIGFDVCITRELLPILSAKIPVTSKNIARLLHALKMTIRPILQRL